MCLYVERPRRDGLPNAAMLVVCAPLDYGPPRMICIHSFGETRLGKAEGVRVLSSVLHGMCTTTVCVSIEGCLVSVSIVDFDYYFTMKYDVLLCPLGVVVVDTTPPSQRCAFRLN